MVHGKTVVRSILLLPFLMLPASADMGSFPLVSGEIHEEEQSAIIVLDTARHRETIILQTNVRSNREVTGVFFMPLPAKPAARLAPEDAFERVLGLARTKGLKCYQMADTLNETNGGGGLVPDARPGISLVLHQRLGDHQVTAVELADVASFRSWSIEFLARNRVATPFDFAQLQPLVGEYFQDGFKFFLFDIVRLSPSAATMKPLAITFASDEVYYPLRVNRLYSGKSDVLLLLFSDVSFPTERFAQIGFSKSASVSVRGEDRKELGAKLGRLLPTDPLTFQCFLLEDPRRLLPFFKTAEPGLFRKRKPGLLQILSELQRQAMARWEHDVRISTLWGKSHDPEYEVRQPYDVLMDLLGYGHHVWE